MSSNWHSLPFFKIAVGCNQAVEDNRDESSNDIGLHLSLHLWTRLGTFVLVPVISKMWPTSQDISHFSSEFFFKEIVLKSETLKKNTVQYSI